MAIDMSSDVSSLGTSPRISFSHDLRHTDAVPIEGYPYRSDSALLDSNSEFDFCISHSDGIENETSSADELFSDGLIRPLQIPHRFTTTKLQPLPSLPPLPLPSKQESSKETLLACVESEPKPQSKSFWRIKRSSSLHCDNTYKKSSIWSLPLLSRSYSTGSVPNSKQVSKNSYKQVKNLMVNSSSSSSSSFYMYPLSQKPPLKKSYGGSHGNGVRISPVLNVPPPYISKGTANLFGLGSFFGNGKDKKKNK